MNHSSSVNAHRRMSEKSPGGVSSPVRAFDPYPLTVREGKGCRITDIDGNVYVDLCMAYGPLIHGHADDDIIAAICVQASKGTTFGAPSEPEETLISMLLENVPCADMVRLTNSGTEATMHAVRLARGYTAKNGIIKMRGGFHGAHDTLLADSLPGGNVRATSEGIPGASVKDTFIAEYNDITQMDALLEMHDIAAVIMEPVMGNAGVIPPERDYLDKVRRLTKEHGALLVFDEVITGARLSAGGAQQLYGVTPDLCTMGKIIGGGLPAGAVMGKQDIMSMFAPLGPVFQSGTFSGNPLTCAAGVTALSKMTPSAYVMLNKTSDGLVHSMNDALDDRGVKGCVQNVGSMFQVFFGIDKVTNASQTHTVDRDMFERMFRHMMGEGIYLPQPSLETLFLSTAHDLDATSKVTDAFDGFLRCSS